MLEWLTWHRLVGVHHVWMYLDESDLPGSQLTEHSELVEVMRSQEWITLITKRDGWDVLLEFKQGEVMRHCTLSAQGKVDWTGHWDVDEMLVIGPRLTPPIDVDLPLKRPSFTERLQVYPNEVQVIQLARAKFTMDGSIYPHMKRGQASGFTEFCGLQPGKWIS